MFQRVQYAKMYLLALKTQGKAKMELPLDMVSKHAFLYFYMREYNISLIIKYECSLTRDTYCRTYKHLL